MILKKKTVIPNFMIFKFTLFPSAGGKEKLRVCICVVDEIHLADTMIF